MGDFLCHLGDFLGHLWTLIDAGSKVLEVIFIDILYNRTLGRFFGSICERFFNPIELQPRNVKRRWTTDPKGKAKWSVNGEKKNEKEIRAFVADLNIQTDNLCQFLPQDKGGYSIETKLA